MGREAMQAVELSDEPVRTADADVTVSGSAPRPAGTPRRNRRRRWAIGVAATLVVGLVGTQTVLDARERSRVARLASLPGVLAPVDASIGSLWSSDDWAPLSALAGSAFGDVMIGPALAETGERKVLAVRPRTGEVVWETVLAPADPVALARGSGSSPSCTTDERAATPQVVCLVSDSASVGNLDAPPAPVPATFARLVVLDPLTGDVVAQHDEPLSSAAWVGLLDGLAVVASRSDGGHLVVVGQDPRTGDERWRFESPEPLAPALPTAWTTDPSGLTPAVVDGRVAVTASGGEVWVLSDDGEVVDRTPAGDRTGVEVLREGLVAVVDYDMSTPTGRSMRLVGHDAPTAAAAGAQPMTLSVDDGSDPDLLFTVTDRLVAWDTTTWDVAWSRDIAVDLGAILLDGRLYTQGPDGHVLALDAATGDTLWEVPLAGGASSLFTDGRSILASEPVATGGSALVALAPDDGRRLWDAPLPGTTRYLWPLGRRLIGMSDNSIGAVVLG